MSRHLKLGILTYLDVLWANETRYIGVHYFFMTRKIFKCVWLPVALLTTRKTGPIPQYGSFIFRVFLEYFHTTKTFPYSWNWTKLWKLNFSTFSYKRYSFSSVTEWSFASNKYARLSSSWKYTLKLITRIACIIQVRIVHLHCLTRRGYMSAKPITRWTYSLLLHWWK